MELRRDTNHLRRGTKSERDLSCDEGDFIRFRNVHLQRGHILEVLIQNLIGFLECFCLSVGVDDQIVGADAIHHGKEGEVMREV